MLVSDGAALPGDVPSQFRGCHQPLRFSSGSIPSEMIGRKVDWPDRGAAQPEARVSARIQGAIERVVKAAFPSPSQARLTPAASHATTQIASLSPRPQRPGLAVGGCRRNSVGPRGEPPRGTRSGDGDPLPLSLEASASGLCDELYVVVGVERCKLEVDIVA